MVDINFYTIHIADSLDRDNLPGLIIMNPPKRAARGRESDLLVALITLKGPSSISSESLRSWLEKKCEEYFQTSGTVTFAMRTLVEKINQELLGEMIGVTRKTVNFHLSAFEREGLVQVGYGRIVLCDVERLRAVANE